MNPSLFFLLLEIYILGIFSFLSEIGREKVRGGWQCRCLIAIGTAGRPMMLPLDHCSARLSQREGKNKYYYYYYVHFYGRGPPSRSVSAVTIGLGICSELGYALVFRGLYQRERGKESLSFCRLCSNSFGSSFGSSFNSSFGSSLQLGSLK